MSIAERKLSRDINTISKSPSSLSLADKSDSQKIKKLQNCYQIDRTHPVDFGTTEFDFKSARWFPIEVLAKPGGTYASDLPLFLAEFYNLLVYSVSR
jgi:hypothetical protein